MSTKNKSVHDKMAELSEMVDWFQGDDFQLEEAVVKFEQAESLAQEIEADLSSLKNDIKRVAERFDEPN
ncbi:hypothetical protein B7Y94_03320 [Candidatus Saccharibacteria bacterium 32-49-12]|nr:MAG: hypothetical protein B7Y94_03320 [Candidatus Saccharibacteria bacterium 32-49-12]